MGPLMDVPALAARFDAGQRTGGLDVGWARGDPQSREHDLEGRLPGASGVDVDTEVATTATTAPPERLPQAAAVSRVVPSSTQSPQVASNVPVHSLQVRLASAAERSPKPKVRGRGPLRPGAWPPLPLPRGRRNPGQARVHPME